MSLQSSYYPHGRRCGGSSCGCGSPWSWKWGSKCHCHSRVFCTRRPCGCGCECDRGHDYDHGCECECKCDRCCPPWPPRPTPPHTPNVLDANLGSSELNQLIPVTSVVHLQGSAITLDPTPTTSIRLAPHKTYIGNFSGIYPSGTAQPPGILEVILSNVVIRTFETSVPGNVSFSFAIIVPPTVPNPVPQTLQLRNRGIAGRYLTLFQIL